MDSEECQKALLTRIQKVVPYWNARAIVGHIFDVLTLHKIRLYVDGPDAGIHTLIVEMENSMRSRAGSPGPEYPPPSWNSQGQSSNTFEGTQAASAGQIGNSQLPDSSSVPDDEMHDFPATSLNSQAQSTGTFEGIQAASAGQIGTSHLPGSSSVRDDGADDFPHPSWNSQAQSSGSASVGIQSATAGQIVTLQIPDDKSIDLKEHSQSSSVPGCSNVTGYLPSTSRPWPRTCYFYILTRGLCKKGLSCGFSHGFGPSGKLEMQIRQLLLGIPYAAVPVEALSTIYFQCYNKDLPVGKICDPRSPATLLQSLHTICWVSDSYGQDCLALLERYQAYIGYAADPRHWHVRHTQIYICFSAASRSICTGENVSIYFSQYGPVWSVTIPHQSTYGFVRFQYPGTVGLLLSEWNPQVPHFIFGEEVHVHRYIPKGEPKLKNTAGKHVLDNGCNPGIVTEERSGTSAAEIALPLTHSQPSDSQMEIVPLEVLLDGLVPDGVGINPVEGGEVPGGLEINPLEVPLGEEVPGDFAGDPADGQAPGDLDGDPADEHDDEMVARLPDVSCFYKQT